MFLPPFWSRLSGFCQFLDRERGVMFEPSVRARKTEGRGQIISICYVFTLKTNPVTCFPFKYPSDSLWLFFFF